MRPPRRGRSRHLRKTCFFCDNSLEPDYKASKVLRRMVTDRGRILPRRITSTCAVHQRQVANEVKKARHIALLPFMAANLNR